MKNDIMKYLRVLRISIPLLLIILYVAIIMPLVDAVWLHIIIIVLLLLCTTHYLYDSILM